jgi:hypothetical protein
MVDMVINSLQIRLEEIKNHSKIYILYFDKFNIHEVNQSMNRIEPRDRRAKFADTFCRNDSCDARAPF